MKISDLQQYDDDGALWFSFRFGGGDDFNRSLAIVKSAPYLERQFDSSTKEWHLVDNPANRARLADAFENFDHELDILLSQGSLF